MEVGARAAVFPLARDIFYSLCNETPDTAETVAHLLPY